MTTPYAHSKVEVERLVERFARNLDAYRRAEYKEAQVRAEFIDPLFEALGWDMRNVQGYAEQYKDVIHEDAIKVGGATQAPDYCFRVGGVRKFFLEAKKPSVWVKGHVGPAYQLRRYAWSAKLPLSILTDFEEFAAYDCLQRPRLDDKPGVGRIIYLTFDQYPERFDDIYGVFGKEPVLQGSFDRYAQDTRRKHGTSEVDAEFLKEIEGWRDGLARNVALRNPALSVHELNYAVQRTIDRIIFLRMCEDRGVEDYGRLLALTGGPSIYARLGELYRQADEKYDSDLFDFQADTLSRSLAVDDKVLKPILAGLYYPQSPYEFSVLPTEILGQVYEQFLGKVIRLTAGHRAVVEEKPEVKKAGGVYYTPAYIVDYIVKQTVGRLVEGKTPRQVSPLRILDAACGSGSFLLGAYQYLLDYHLRWYGAHDPAKVAQGKQPAVYQGPHGEWRLTTAEKKRILLNNIYGVDIDRQAVEVTKLSLLLKVLEGENQETLGQQLALWRERALPDLASNVKCGNSLIGPDYFEGQLMPDEEEMRRVNPFGWRAEFPEIMAAGGFDVVIGNPPYRKERESRELLADLRNSSYGKLHYQGKMDYWYFFLHRAIDVTKPSGHISFIVPSYWLKSSGASKLISRVRKECAFIDAVDFGKSKVFSQVSGLHMVFVLIKGVRHQKLSYQRYTATNLSPSEIQEVLRTRCVLRSQVDLLDSESIFTEDDEIDFERQQYLGFLTKLEQNSFPLERGERIFEVSQGIVEAPNIISAQMARKAKMPHLAGEGVFVVGRSVIESYAFNLHEKPFIKKYLRPEDVTRYHYEFGEYYVFYIGSRDNKRIIANQGKYPNIVKHLGQYREFITSSNAPFGIHRTRKHHFFVSERLLCPNMFDKPSFTYCQDEYYVNFSFNVIIRGVSTYSLKYLLGILNSSLGAFWFDLHAKKRGVNNDVGVGIMRRFPVHSINFDDPADVARHDKMVTLVERMLELHKKLAAATIPADKTLYQRQIEAADRQIDALVYELYGLTEEEIAIVEGRS